MGRMPQRLTGKIVALVLLGATIFVGGEYLAYSNPGMGHVVSAAAPLAAPVTSVAPPAAQGCPAVVNAATAASVYMTSKRARARGRRAQRDPTEACCERDGCPRG